MSSARSSVIRWRSWPMFRLYSLRTNDLVNHAVCVDLAEFAGCCHFASSSCRENQTDFSCGNMRRGRIEWLSSTFVQVWA